MPTLPTVSLINMPHTRRNMSLSCRWRYANIVMPLNIRDNGDVTTCAIFARATINMLPRCTLLRAIVHALCLPPPRNIITSSTRHAAPTDNTITNVWFRHPRQPHAEIPCASARHIRVYAMTARHDAIVIIVAPLIRIYVHIN